MSSAGPDGAAAPRNPIDWLVDLCLNHRLIPLIFIVAIVLWGIRVAPFDLAGGVIPRDPIPVDAIPDLGENQQVVFTDWPGRSPQDVEDQITFPLTTALQGVAGFKSIRAFSMFGFSVVYVIFDEAHDFYWCRARLLEKINSVQRKLPEGVTPLLGPDATALGQVFWYTLEGSRGGFDLMELRSAQDWIVRYALQAVPGVSEVASVGGYVREYQIDVDPDALRAHGVRLPEILTAVQRANIDVGAETIEWNGVEYVLRSRGFARSLSDLENIVVRVNENVPILVRHVARVQVGPALRRGALDKDGVPAVGGVVLARYGANSLEVIQSVKRRIAELAPGLPSKTLENGEVSRIDVVPFYDRAQLIQETLDTLSQALVEQVLVTIFVVLMFLRHLRSCAVICVSLPLAILVCFILMKLFQVDSNLMSLCGIAIAIGTLVDMGIILSENIVRHIQEDAGRTPLVELIRSASREISSAVTTAILMTVIAFLPVFALDGPEGRLFRPLAYTKTFALLGSLLVAIVTLPALASVIFTPWGSGGRGRAWLAPFGLALLGAGFIVWGMPWAGWAAIAFGVFSQLEARLPAPALRWGAAGASLVVMAGVLLLLTRSWMPLGEGAGVMRNLLIVLGINLAWASVRVVFIDFYPYFLRLFLEHKLLFLSFPAAVVTFGLVAWLGFARVFGFAAPATPDDAAPDAYQRLWAAAVRAHPGMGREFMPPLDEGSFLFMPSLMPHASIGAALDVLAQQDRAIRAIPEVASVVGKIGRAETAIDPAPTSMVETVVNYKPEFRRDPLTQELLYDDQGRPIRDWREHIRTPDDIWSEIQRAAELPGVTAAPRLQPIAARLVMLQSGMRAAMGVKIFGPTLEQIEAVAFEIAEALRGAPGVAPETVVPDRVIGKPYLEIELDRERMARYGVNIRDGQDAIEVALGGAAAGYTVEGRERYPIRLRYPRELRDDIESIERIIVPGVDGEQAPLSQLATVRYVRGPLEIKSEDNALVAYVLFDKKPGWAEVDVVEQAADAISARIAGGEMKLPAGVRYQFAGAYENQVRFQQRLSIILPLSLLMLLLLLYFQFRSIPISLIVFTGIPVAWAGGFIGLWLIAQPWFCDLTVFGENVRHLLHFQQYNLSAAVWVGFIALFSVTTDDGVVLATYLGSEFEKRRAASIAEIRAAIISVGTRRVRPCLMTSATTVLSLMPVLTSDGRGADVMIPIALPAIGGLSIELLSLFVLPVCYSAYREWQWRSRRGAAIE